MESSSRLCGMAAPAISIFMPGRSMGVRLYASLPILLPICSQRGLRTEAKWLSCAFPLTKRRSMSFRARRGQERKVTTLSTQVLGAAGDVRLSNRQPGPAWSADGRSIVIADSRGRSGPDALYEFSLDNKRERLQRGSCSHLSQLTAPTIHWMEKRSFSHRTGSVLGSFGQQGQTA